jgi:hypothetical protein
MPPISRRKFLSLSTLVLTAGCGGGGGGESGSVATAGTGTGAGASGTAGTGGSGGTVSGTPSVVNTPVEPQQPQQPHQPQQPQQPRQSEQPEQPEQPQEAEEPQQPEQPPPTTNVIRAENAKTANEGVTSRWYINDADYASQGEIEGYASATSVHRGGSIRLFVNTPEPTYTISIYRVGWYGGAGGRRVAGPISRTGRRQPAPSFDASTRLVECDWSDPYVLAIPNNHADPTDWASGVYLAKLTAGASGKQSYITFVVRDDARSADLMFQASVTTYAAYNNWGGYNFYDVNSVGGLPAYKLSFNRPYSNPQQPCAGKGAGDFLGWELHMLRFLEREGYDVTYTDNIAVHAAPERLPRHRAFLSVGHDEYWTRGMRNAIEGARDQGVHLGAFGANTGYWQVRLESSASGEADRTVVCYKFDSPARDPVYASDPARSTLLWRDPSIGRPEAALLGVMYDYNTVDLDMVMDDCTTWVTAGTTLKKGDRLPGMLGYEVDRVDPDSTPRGTKILASSPYHVIGSGELRHANMSVYTHSSGARVFATGSMQWNWGLDDFGPRGDRVNSAVQQMTRNVMNAFIQK